MKQKNLVTILGQCGSPSPDVLDTLREIVDAQVAKVDALPQRNARSYHLMIALNVYAYGVMQGKRIERKRRREQRS